MINTQFLQYIPEDKREEIYKILVEDVYYFYHGTREQFDNIKIKNGQKWDLSKGNLELIM